MDLPVIIRQDGHAAAEGVAVDISQGGMFVRTETVLPFAESIILTIDLPGLGPTDLPAFVRWTTPEGFGVQFGLLGARETHAINELTRR